MSAACRRSTGGDLDRGLEGLGDEEAARGVHADGHRVANVFHRGWLGGGVNQPDREPHGELALEGDESQPAAWRRGAVG